MPQGDHLNEGQRWLMCHVCMCACCTAKHDVVHRHVHGTWYTRAMMLPCSVPVAKCCTARFAGETQHVHPPQENPTWGRFWLPGVVGDMEMAPKGGSKRDCAGTCAFPRLCCKCKQCAHAHACDVSSGFNSSLAPSSRSALGVELR